MEVLPPVQEVKNKAQIYRWFLTSISLSKVLFLPALGVLGWGDVAEALVDELSAGSPEPFDADNRGPKEQKRKRKKCWIGEDSPGI